MSVINSVLKDLETRESRFTPIEIDSVSAQSTARRDPKPFALLALSLLVLTAGGWFYLQQQPVAIGVAPVSLLAADGVAVDGAQTEPEPVLEAIDKPVADKTVAAAIVPEPMAANQIIGLQMRESEQDMRLEFVLRDKVVAYLKQRRENSFGYHLRDIESQIVAPEISDNPWITDLSINVTPQGVDIEFDTVPEILVETRQSLVDGVPVWAIGLRKAQTPAVPEVAPVAVIETTVAAADPLNEPDPEPTASAEIAQSPRAVETTELESAPEVLPVKLEIKSIDPNAKSANQLEYAVELINSRRYGDAENLLLGMLTGVEDYRARQHLLALYQASDRADRLDQLARESVTRYPEDGVFRTEYGRSLFQGAEYRAVIQLLGGEVRLDSDQQAMLAASYQRLDEHSNAIRHYRQALELNAKNAKNWIGLGISLEHSSELEAALASYRRAGRLGNLNSRLQSFVEKRSRMLEQVLN